MFRRRFQPLGLGGRMTGNALVEPALDLGGQMDDMGRHSVVLCNTRLNPSSRVTPDSGVDNGYSMSRRQISISVSQQSVRLCFSGPFPAALWPGDKPSPTLRLAREAALPPNCGLLTSWAAFAVAAAA